MSWLLSLLGSIPGAIVAALGAIGAIFGLYWKAKAKRQADYIAEQTQAIKVHEKIEETHKQDIATDYTTEDKIDEIREQVDHAPTQQDAANTVSQALNGYFAEDDKK